MEAPKSRNLYIIVAIVLTIIALIIIFWLARINPIDFLRDFFTNPAVYFPLLFIYSFLAAIILPIPIEIALLWPLLANDMGLYAAATIVMAAGKAIGGWAVFFIGIKLEDDIRMWSKRFKIAETVVNWCIEFVRKTNYIGLFILLSIPLMSDTAVLYIYSLFNEEGEVLNMSRFVIVNFFAAIVRSLILLGLWTIGVNLFG
jgi:membrane protein YqaA with SNARE-associated domain